MLRGRCACNAVAYEVSDEFVAAYSCHCSNCRALTGAAFLPVGRIERDKLTVTKGADSLRVEGDPGSTYEVRCSECFSLLYWTSRDVLRRAVWNADRRAFAQADVPPVRRLEGSVVRDPRRPSSARHASCR